MYKSFLARWVLPICFLAAGGQVQAQDTNTNMYNLNLWIDIPVGLAAGGLTAYGFHKISGQPEVDSATILAADPNSINGFDRGATRQFSDKAENLSDYFFYGSFFYPLVLLFDKNVRQEIGTFGMMYYQSIAINSAIYSNAAGHTSRLRPYVYNTDTIVPYGDKKSLHARNSFIGGHPSITAAATFFTAKVYADYHPDSPFRFVLYGIAATATATNAYLRYKAGKHFPTDLLVGVGVGTASGLLVPVFHKNKKKNSLSVVPAVGDYKGITLNYKF